jgi:hypothetical protein
MRKWYQVALFNLLVLTLLALIIRYKINFPLSFLEQKKLLHAHSHFAFNGWVSFLLQLLILEHFTEDYQRSRRFWNRFFLWSTIINYGMIISFALQGYAPISIALSTIGIILSYVFCFKIYRSLQRGYKQVISRSFVKASLLFLVLSSFGTYALAAVIATKNAHTFWYHNSLYFFLHFQYNGWFTFAVMGFLFKKMESAEGFNAKYARIFFILLAGTCIPSYLLTMLFLHTPSTVTVINVITVVLQAIGLVYLSLMLRSGFQLGFRSMPAVSRWLYSLSLCGFFLKILLQFFSAHPEIGQLAFAFRPIIIGYLHLIFLVFVSFYLLSLLAEQNVIPLRYSFGRGGLTIFSAGALLNELLLGLQGVASISYFHLPFIPILLFFVTIVIVAGGVFIFLSSLKNFN